MIPDSTYFPWILGIAATFVLLYLAWRRPNRKRLPWRMAASVIAVVSLALLVFPPSFERPLDPGSAILLTEGYEPDTLNALLQDREAAPLVYSYKTGAADAKPIANMYTLLQEQPQLQTVHLVGNGLTTRELEALRSLKVIPHLSVQPAGIINVYWPTTTTLGKTVEVTGQYNVPEGEAVKLYLLAAGKMQDSILFEQPGLSPFKLNFIPKQEGSFLYQVLTRTENQTDTLGQVPIHVVPAEKLAVLLLSSAPLFEFKFLKNHLGELQHRVALRSTVSKGILQSEWINMPHTSLGRITPGLLEQFDLVITEPQALQEMSRSERTALQQAVTESGLGVLTIRGAQQPNSVTSFFTGFRSKRVSQQETYNTSVSWAGIGKVSATAIPYTLVNDDALAGLVRENDSEFLAAAKKEGWGTVAISMIPQTFSWKLEGKEKVYASYWAHILSEIAKKKEQEKFWQLISPQAPKQGHPVEFIYTDFTIGDLKNVPDASVRSLADTSGTKMSFEQDQHLPEQFRTTFWPQSTGWHVTETPEAPDFYFFVQDTLNWEYEPTQQKRTATRQFAAQQDVTVRAGNLATTEEQVPILWFFLLFVVSSGFLWLEEKL